MSSKKRSGSRKKDKMKEAFQELNSAYKENEFESIFHHQYGNYFLKLRSLSRTEILQCLAQRLKIKTGNIPRNDLFEYLFCQNIREKNIDDFIREVYKQDRAVRIGNENDLYSQLYRLKIFDWGGFYQNAVEQTIVNNYIKKIRSYRELLDKIEKEINPKMKGYVLCSWYNHWTSILIEDMFKDHKDILPSVGLVKKVDFFWHDFPFDLKVTYFPDGFMKLKRKDLKMKSELSELKRFARENTISFDDGTSDDDIFSELFAKIIEDPSKAAKKFLKQFHTQRRRIINQAIKNPKELIKWFYENQGKTRFDAANRFFLVLIDLHNLEDSWKLKRNKKIVQRRIRRYLNQNKSVNFDRFRIGFKWDGKDYQTYATCLFVLKT